MLELFALIHVNSSSTQMSALKACSVLYVLLDWLIYLFLTCMKHDLVVYISVADENNGNGVSLSERSELPGHAEVSSEMFVGVSKY